MPVGYANAPSRRFTSRVPTLPIPIGDVWVYWESGNRRDISRVRDISMHGLFIETPKPMIKGAFTRNRLRQTIFGGATRHIMHHADLPLFMAH